MKPPSNLRELLDYLTAHPRVYAHHPIACAAGPRRFLGIEKGGLWFVTDEGLRSYVPINCGAVSAETGFEFGDRGFTVTKFDMPIFYEYVAPPGIAPRPAEAATDVVIPRRHED